MELISPPLRLSILITLLITLGGVAWACLARIPVYVNGVAYLLRMDNIGGLPALTDGQVHYQFSATALVRSPLFARLYRLNQQPDAVGDAELTALARDLLATRPTGPQLSTSNPYAGLVPKGQVLAWIDSPLNRSDLASRLLSFDQAKTTLASQQLELRRLDRKIKAKIDILGKQLDVEAAYLASITRLQKEGFASKANVLVQRTRVDAIRSEILTQQEERVANSQKTVEAETALKQALISLRSTLNDYIDRTFLFADNPLYIVDLNIPQAGQVKQQDNVLHVAPHALNRLPNRIPGFLSQSDADQVARGMAVLVTPVGLDRAQFGGIVGTVADVSLLPSNIDQIAERSGSMAIAQEVTALIPDPVRVDLILRRNPSDREPNHGGFRWSSPGSPPFPLTTGNQLSLQITAQQVRPISLLIPFLMRATGASPPRVPLQRRPSPAAGTPAQS